MTEASVEGHFITMAGKHYTAVHFPTPPGRKSSHSRDCGNYVHMCCEEGVITCGGEGERGHCRHRTKRKKKNALFIRFIFRIVIIPILIIHHSSTVH